MSSTSRTSSYFRDGCKDQIGHGHPHIFVESEVFKDVKARLNVQPTSYNVSICEARAKRPIRDEEVTKALISSFPEMISSPPTKVFPNPLDDSAQRNGKNPIEEGDHIAVCRFYGPSLPPGNNAIVRPGDEKSAIPPGHKANFVFIISDSGLGERGEFSRGNVRAIFSDVKPLGPGELAQASRMPSPNRTHEFWGASPSRVPSFQRRNTFPLYISPPFNFPSPTNMSLVPTSHDPILYKRPRNIGRGVRQGVERAVERATDGVRQGVERAVERATDGAIDMVKDVVTEAEQAVREATALADRHPRAKNVAIGAIAYLGFS